MKAPTPVSTYLHSATMVKAGIYLLLRFTPHFEANPQYFNIMLIVGGITMLYAAINTLFKDRKSTRLNSSHVRISYAVFCLKKKKKTNTKNAHNIHDSL